MLEQLKESVEAGMKLCGELLESFVLVFRSRKELLAEIEERRKKISYIDQLQNWWNYSFSQRWFLKRTRKKGYSPLFAAKAVFILHGLLFQA